MDYKTKAKSINVKIIMAFTFIMILTIISIKVFMNLSFDSAFEKYVDDSNRAEVKHLMFDLKHIYKDGSWDINTIKELGEDAIYKGIALEIYDKDKKLVWSIFEDEKVLSNITLKKISEDMQSIDNKWNDKFSEYKLEVKDENGEVVGYPYIGHYASTYYMENDMEFFKIMNKYMLLIGIMSITGIIIISIIISKSISNPIAKVSKMTKVIEKGNYKDKLNYKSNIKEVDELILSINKLASVLNQQEKLRKRLTTDISHELRTPITSIKGHLDVIIAGIWEPTTERLISINEEVSRMNNLIDELGSLAKYDNEKEALEIEEIDLSKLLKNIVFNLESKAMEKDIYIECELQEIKISADKKKVSQVLVNIISNAIKYTREKGKIYIKTYNDNEYTNISIKDNGIGIPIEDVSYIFERFYRVDKSRNKETGGIGVGLSIAKSIIEKHKGNIIVKSDISKGSEFIVRLPNKPDSK